MRLEPLGKWINARAAVSKAPGKIIIPGVAHVTRCYVVDAVGPEAAKEGFKPGDVIVAKHCFDMYFESGTFHRVTFQTDEAIQRVHDTHVVDGVLIGFVDVYDKPFRMEDDQRQRAYDRLESASA